MFMKQPNSGYSSSGTQARTTAFCLGQPAHTVGSDTIICRLCGHLVAGAQLGVYQVQRHLGSSRFGRAYLAFHVRSKQPVTLKLLYPDPANSSLWEEARSEVRRATLLRHPSIQAVFSCAPWQPDQRQASTRPLHEFLSTYNETAVYLLTLCQYAPGNIQQLLLHYEQQKRVSQERQAPSLRPLLFQLIQQAGAALSAAHEKNIVHGALTPGNILVDGRDRLWLADFGLGRMHPPAVPYLAPELYDIAQTSLQTGRLRLYWDAVTPLSDQYMLGVLCQQLFTRLLLPQEYEVMRSVLQCATHAQPTQRFASIDIFLHELLAQSGMAPTARSGSMPGFPGVAPVKRQFLGAKVTPQLTQDDVEQLKKMAVYNLGASVPRSPVDDWEKLGGKLFTNRDYNGAVHAYQQAISLDGRRSSLWLALGDAYFALERYPDALDAYNQAIQLDPADPESWTNRGATLDALGKHQEATECYERAEQLSR
ncbi:TPR repeat protein [Thermosporothrix hazakensis]|uniref:TPR repeat protein n=3 Tax=Thermosporothrix TaxID=768650 RepID=A0A326U4F0_THEHA|nr:TPR repeat protein [Thermosporothrix hazakensis]